MNNRSIYSSAGNLQNRDRERNKPDNNQHFKDIEDDYEDSQTEDDFSAIDVIIKGPTFPY